jgi:hypothetical protein
VGGRRVVVVVRQSGGGENGGRSALLLGRHSCRGLIRADWVQSVALQAGEGLTTVDQTE